MVRKTITSKKIVNFLWKTLELPQCMVLILQYCVEIEYKTQPFCYTGPQGESWQLSSCEGPYLQTYHCIRFRLIWLYGVCSHIVSSFRIKKMTITSIMCKDTYHNWFRYVLHLDDGFHYRYPQVLICSNNIIVKIT